MKIILFFILTTFSFFAKAQLPKAKEIFTFEDTLRGSITTERAWWDLTYYDLNVKVNIDSKSIEGSNTIHYRVLSPFQVLQIDLQSPLIIDKILQDNKILSFQKRGANAYFIDLIERQEISQKYAITVYYKGIPKEAVNAPWDGGFSWSKDDQGNPFVATSCQGLGASVWWPCKDHMYDEPDSMSIAVTVPKNLMDVSNGKLKSIVDNSDGTKTYQWAVKNPINNYGVNINIGNYVHFSEIYAGEKGYLEMNYYVLPENLEKAKTQFLQASKMMKAFEHWFGPYPFYEDGYKLVEVPYLGMEHQSSVTYGNKFRNGYLGKDWSETGWGLKWDYIIIHESGHEWFANNITYKDIADMWIHESFTAYSESLFTEYYYGQKAGAEYVIGTRKAIENEAPIIGKYNVNHEGSGDMYFKGANMLHTIRQLVADDIKWRKILRGLNKEFYHQTVTAADIQNYIIKKSNLQLQKVFDQYLTDTRIPVLEYKLENGIFKYRWANCITDFNMPIKIELKPGKFEFICPTTTWNSTKTKVTVLNSEIVDPNFYVFEKNVGL
jgi:aminopeptidase N